MAPVPSIEKMPISIISYFLFDLYYPETMFAKIVPATLPPNPAAATSTLNPLEIRV